MDVYFRSCPRDVRVTTIIFRRSLANAWMRTAVTGRALKPLQRLGGYPEAGQGGGFTHPWDITLGVLPASRFVWKTTEGCAVAAYFRKRGTR